MAAGHPAGPGDDVPAADRDKDQLAGSLKGTKVRQAVVVAVQHRADGRQERDVMAALDEH